MMVLLQKVFAGCVLGGLLLVAGCAAEPSDGSVPVTGKVTISGVPVTVPPSPAGESMVELKFYPLDAQGQENGSFHQVMVGGDGSFSVLGPSNKGLPPGKYRIVVRQWDPFPSVDKLNGKFDETNSKIVRDIAGPTVLDLDLAKVEP